jgi:hypothetical protein
MADEDEEFEELADDVKACIVDKKDPTRCIDAVFKDHGIDSKKKMDVLTEIIKEDNE